MGWRKAIVKVMCQNRFLFIFTNAQNKSQAAAKVQSLFRMNAKRKELQQHKAGALMAQKLYRARLARKVLERKRQEEAKKKLLKKKKKEKKKKEKWKKKEKQLKKL